EGCTFKQKVLIPAWQASTDEFAARWLRFSSTYALQLLGANAYGGLHVIAMRGLVRSRALSVSSGRGPSPCKLSIYCRTLTRALRHGDAAGAPWRYITSYSCLSSDFTIQAPSFVVSFVVMCEQTRSRKSSIPKKSTVAKQRNNGTTKAALRPNRLTVAFASAEPIAFCSVPVLRAEYSAASRLARFFLR